MAREEVLTSGLCAWAGRHGGTGLTRAYLELNGPGSGHDLRLHILNRSRLGHFQMSGARDFRHDAEGTDTDVGELACIHHLSPFGLDRRVRGGLERVRATLRENAFVTPLRV